MKQNVLVIRRNQNATGKDATMASDIMAMLSYTIKFRFNAEEKGWANSVYVAEIDTEKTAYEAIEMLAEYLDSDYYSIKEYVEIVRTDIDF